jgi:hypothetical protein
MCNPSCGIPARRDDRSWLNGPPDAVEEIVFDEYDLPGCFRTEAELLVTVRTNESVATDGFSGAERRLRCPSDRSESAGGSDPAAACP